MGPAGRSAGTAPMADGKPPPAPQKGLVKYPGHEKEPPQRGYTVCATGYPSEPDPTRQDHMANILWRLPEHCARGWRERRDRPSISPSSRTWSGISFLVPATGGPSAKDSEIPDRVRDDDGAEGSAFRWSRHRNARHPNRVSRPEIVGIAGLGGAIRFGV